ncbi:two-component sensor histidine kinase [Nocardia brasiliensis]|uniref:histidine kinase n=1 Tax=Nocardia brasiliensis TaxID=37326 RepID=A0A6G9XW07_NOCBR|nr:sensor histidine kinase [Nocardia brasiliensis]QIS05099.1 two-component sensor histidine kinase [Nocardia brasiliensis]
MKRINPWLADLTLVALAAADVYVDGEATTVGTRVAGLVACAGLLLRRRSPLVSFLLTLPVSLLLAPLVAPAVALYTLAEATKTRALPLCAALATAITASLPWPDADNYRTPDTLVSLVYSLAWAGAPVLLGQLMRTRRELSTRLSEIEAARDHERLLHAQAVLARERAQIGREMHDVVAHQVSLIAVSAGALQVATTDAAAAETARTIRRLSVDTLDELRHMVTLLRAAGGQGTELTPQPTLADLRKLLDSSGIQVELRGDLPPDLGAPAQRTIYRTVQEALTNVRKHAPGATAEVRLWHDTDHLGVTVTNTRPTRPAMTLPSSRHGLVGLGERAELLGGTFTSGPRAEGGYRAELRLPR